MHYLAACHACAGMLGQVFLATAVPGRQQHPARRPMHPDPTPSTPLVIVSLVVILACLGLISVFASLIVSGWDPCSAIAGLILSPLPIALAIGQYRGTFRRVRSAARFTAVLLFLVGGFAAYSFVSALAKLTAGTHGSWMRLLQSVAIPLLLMLFVAASAPIAGWVNLRWVRVLPKTASPQPRLQFTLRELLGFTAAMAFVVALTTVQIQSTPLKYAEHVERADAGLGLPENATDVSYCRGSGGTIAYEFTTTEAGFREWVDSGIGSLESQADNVPIQPITKPVSINRYNRYSADLTGPDSITVTVGLDYWWRYQDRSVHAVFDSSTNRAYYAAHYH